MHGRAAAAAQGLQHDQLPPGAVFETVDCAGEEEEIKEGWSTEQVLLKEQHNCYS